MLQKQFLERKESPDQHCESCDAKLAEIISLEDENHALRQQLVTLEEKMENRTRNMREQGESWKAEALDVMETQEREKAKMKREREMMEAELGCQEWRIVILEIQARKLREFLG